MEGKACNRGSFGVFSIPVEHYVLLNFGQDLSTALGFLIIAHGAVCAIRSLDGPVCGSRVQCSLSFSRLLSR